MSRTCAPSVSLPDATHAAYLAAGGPPLAKVVLAHEEAWLEAQGLPVPPRPPPPRNEKATEAANKKNAAKGKTKKKKA